MGHAGINQRVDDERLLSECDDPGGANTGSAGELPRSVHAGKGTQTTIRRANRLPRIVLHGRAARNVTYVHLAIYRVRRNPGDRIHSNNDVGMEVTVVPGGAVLGKSRTVFLDADLIDCDIWHVFFLAERPNCRYADAL